MKEAIKMFIVFTIIITSIIGAILSLLWIIQRIADYNPWLLLPLIVLSMAGLCTAMTISYFRN
jgi:F0F1-type ATP synthase assembly protein I